MKSLIAVLLMEILLPTLASAQADPQSQATAPTQTPGLTQGLTSFIQYQGSSTHLGFVSSLDGNLGYNLNRKFGGDIGLPLFFVRSPFSLVTNHDWRWTTLLGEPYIDLHYETVRSGVNIISVLTGTIPVSSPERIYTTGRFGVDWFNHLEYPYKKFLPFLNLGASNGTTNRYYMPRPFSVGRPYQTLGFMGDFEGGASYKLHHRYTLGASYYALVPGGPQKMFSRLVAPGTSVVGDSNHNRYFYSSFETSGTSSLTRDNGYSGWFQVGVTRQTSIQLGYTRSVRYAYDALSFVINFDMTSLLKTVTGH